MDEKEPTVTITIDMGKKCIRCGNGGATESGYCLRCITKNMREGKYDKILKKGKR